MDYHIYICISISWKSETSRILEKNHICLYLPRWTQCTPNSLWCVEENRQRSAQAMCLRRHSRVGSHAPSHHEWPVHTSICVHAHPFWRRSMRPWLPFHPSTSEYSCALSLLSVYSFRSGPSFMGMRYFAYAVTLIHMTTQQSCGEPHT